MCMRTRLKTWKRVHSYESCYRRITKENWEFVKREAQHQVKTNNVKKWSEWNTYPARVIFDQFHRSRLISVTFDQFYSDDFFDIVETNENGF